jgi:hypothetical protein
MSDVDDNYVYPIPKNTPALDALNIDKRALYNNPYPHNHWMYRNDNTHIPDFNNPFNVDNYLDNKHIINPINFTHQKSIAYYTKYGSVPINLALIDNHKHNTPFKYTNHMQNIDRVLLNNPLQEKLHVYSGTGFDPLDHLNHNKIMFSPAYISATHNKHKAMEFAQPTRTNYTGGKKRRVVNIIHFHLQHNDSAIPIALYSHDPTEHEVLISKHIMLKHHDIETHSDPGRFDNPLLKIHHMSIVR